MSCSVSTVPDYSSVLLCKTLPAIPSESRGVLLLVIPNPDIMSWGGEGIPRDMKPAIAGQELVGVLRVLEEVDQKLELPRVLGADVGGLAQQVLRVADTTHMAVDVLVAKAGVDEDGTDHLSGGFQQILATIFQVK